MSCFPSGSSDGGSGLEKKRSVPSLTKRDSTMSINSSCSVDSDWSDEELEELEKILEDIQERAGNEVEIAEEDEEENEEGDKKVG